MVEDVQSPEKVLQGEIGGNIDKVLTEWSQSDESISFPEKVVYESGFTLEGLEKRKAAGAFKDGFGKGEICFVVSTSNSDGNTLTNTIIRRPNKDAEGVVVFSVFPSNFNSECQRLNKNPKLVVQNAMIDALWQDAIVSAKKQKRAQSEVKGKVGILNKTKSSA